MTDTRAGTGEGVSDVGPWIEMSAATGFDNGKGSGVGGAAFLCPGAEAEPAGNDGDPERSLRFIIRGRQPGIGDEGDDRRPIVEDFPCQRPDFLGFVIPVPQAGPFQPGLDGVEDGVALIFSATAWIRPRSSRTSQSPKRAPSGDSPPAKASPLRIRWARQRWRRW